MHPDEPIHVTIAASEDDPRLPHEDPPGIVVHRVPFLHPDDVDIIDGLRITTVSRTLVDLAECLEREELWAAFARASQLGILDMDAVHASRGRVEWRPSLTMLDEVIDDFDAYYGS